MYEFEKRDFDMGRQTPHVLDVKDLRLSSYYTPSPIDSFLLNEHKSAHSAKKSIRITSDIYMLFNQQRLDKMTLQELAAHFAALVPRDASLSALKSKLTDEQLASIVKSRYIQSQSELLAYSKYLSSLADTELQAIVAAAQQKVVDGSDPTQTPASAPTE